MTAGTALPPRTFGERHNRSRRGGRQRRSSMDVCLARTYLAVVSTGSFVAAAERLNITQTAVSARIRTLEEQLGRSLFVRTKAGAKLTAAGERFFRHANNLVQTWEIARQQIAVPAGRSEGVSVGVEFSLSDPHFADWLVWMHHHQPDIAIRAEVDSSSDLMEKIRKGSLDMGVLHNPPQNSELVAELLCEEKLILVTTAEDGGFKPDDYILVDWGPTFLANHPAAAATPPSPPVSINLGPLARNYLLAVGGAGYFRQGSVQPYLAQGRLRRVEDAPEFSHSIYIVHSAQRDKELIDLLRRSLRDCFVR
nr:LysR family transcriptional regulator [Candidatus Rhodoblastus alkanivorans]